MATIGTAYLQILPSMDGITAKMEQGISGPSASAGKSAGTMIGSAVKKYIGVAAIGSAIVKSVKAGAALEQSLGGVETLYKKHAGTVIKNASKAYRTAGLSANEYMEQSTKFAASLLQSLGGDTKAAAKYADMAIIDMSDNANKFGTNIVDIQNAYQGFAKQNYTMLDNLKLGYGGTRQEMQRLLADASKISGQKYDISNLNDVYDAIHIIQKEMGVTGTTSKEAAATLSGSFASMKSAAENFLGNLALGKNVSKSLSELVSSVSTFLFKNLIPAVINIAKAVPEAIYTGITEGIPTLIRNLPSLITQLFDAAAGILDTISEKISEFVANIGNDPKSIKAGTDLVGKIAVGIIKGAGKLLVAFVKLQGTIAVLLPKLLGIVFQYILVLAKKKVIELVKTIKEKFGKVKSAFTDPLLTAKNKVGSILTGIRAATIGKVANVVESVRTRFSKVKDAVIKPFTAAREKLAGIWARIKAIFKNPVSLKIKVPHLSVSGGKAPWGIGGKGKLPSFDVYWAKKGAIVDGATLIGAGEAGAEAIIPLDSFWKKIDSLKSEQAFTAKTEAGGGTLTAVIQLDGQTIGQTVIDYINGQTIRFGTNPLAV